jgi:hypothetical protein
MSDANDWRGEDAHGSQESRQDKRTVLQPGSTAHVAAESLALGYEVQGVNLRPILQFALAMLVAAVVIHLALWWLLRVQTNNDLNVRLQIQPAVVTPPTGPGPGIEARPAAERAAVLAPAYARITSYGWVDQEAGIVHIPIDKAMELLLAQGLPARSDGETPAFGVAPTYTLDSASGQKVRSSGDQE